MKKFSHRLSILAVAISVSLTPVFAQQVITDGMSATNISVNGNTTNVSTNTVSGGNAFNSLTKLNVDSGNVVNLIVPNNVSNLINIIKGQQSVINGALNGIQNGQIAGNIFLVNPYGVVVGATGSINVGQLTAITPTKDFANNFFTSIGVINPGSLNALLSGTSPINPGASIINNGVINVISNANITSPNIKNNGKIIANASFKPVSDYSTMNIADIINLNAKDSLGITGGCVNLNADKISNYGYIKATGGDVNITRLSTGEIEIVRSKSRSSNSLQLTPTELNKIYASNIILSATDTIFNTKTNLTSTGSMQAYATNKVTIGDFASLTAKDNIVLIGTNGVSTGYLSTVKSINDSITMNSANGSINLGIGSNVSARNDINANAADNVNINYYVSLKAGRDISVYAVNDTNIKAFANLNAKGDVDLTGENSLTIGSFANIKAGDDINLTSNDISILRFAKLKAGDEITTNTP